MVTWEIILFHSLPLYTIFQSKNFYILGSLFVIHKRISLPGKSICKTSNSISYTDFYKHHFNVIVNLFAENSGSRSSLF